MRAPLPNSPTTQVQSPDPNSDRVRGDLRRRTATTLFDVCLHGINVLTDAMGSGLSLPVDENVVGVVVGEHTGPIGVVPVGRVVVRCSSGGWSG